VHIGVQQIGTPARFGDNPHAEPRLPNGTALAIIRLTNGIRWIATVSAVDAAALQLPVQLSPPCTEPNKLDAVLVDRRSGTRENPRQLSIGLVRCSSVGRDHREVTAVSVWGLRRIELPQPPVAGRGLCG
jgi:hypothetical protein